MVIAHNLAAMNTQRQYGITTKSRQKNTEKLASGYRINRAADDAAGLTISEKMRSMIRGLNQGSDNIQDGISLLQIADGAMSEINDMLHRMTELSVKAANGTNTLQDREAIQSEISALSSEITRIGKSTEYNTMPILDDVSGMGPSDSITKLVACESADIGYLSEAIKVNGSYFPSATIDFSNIDESNIDRLANGGFSFNCSRGCDEVFDFKFVNDGTASSGTNLTGKVHHYYTVDISSCKTGEDIINAIFSVVKSYPPRGNDSESTNMLPGAISVSHSNNMVRTSDGKGVTIYANRKVMAYGSYSSAGYSTKEEAEKAYPLSFGYYPKSEIAGAIDCSSLSKIVSNELVNEFNIQCSNVTNDCLTIKTHRVNATILGVDALNITT